MSQQPIPSWEVYACPLGCNEKCPKRWKNRFIDHDILCVCECHSHNSELK